MLVVQGYFEAGQFIADTPVIIPEKKKAIIILDEKEDDKTDEEKKMEGQQKVWEEILEEIENCDEELPGFPTRLQFRTPEEIDAL